MKASSTAIDGMLVIELAPIVDARGWFLESWNQQRFNELLGFEVRFVQDNHSHSVRGVLRGLHYQLPPQAQGKLVRVLRGSVFDVAVDLRRGSKSFGRWVGLTLSQENPRMVWHPPGLAHGFLVIGDSADLIYKTTEHHAPALERCIRWDDPAIGIAWPTLGQPPLISKRDAAAPWLADSACFD